MTCGATHRPLSEVATPGLHRALHFRLGRPLDLRKETRWQPTSLCGSASTQQTDDDLVRRFRGQHYVAKFDLSSGFLQVPVSDDSRALLAFSSKLGRFQFARMPFGARTAPLHFQSEVQKLIQPLSDFCWNYQDDFSVSADNITDALLHLHRFFGFITRCSR